MSGKGLTRAWFGKRAGGLAAATAAILAVAAAFAGSAGAAASGGQLGEAWGKPGSAVGKFFSPAILDVDPSDGSVYTGEEAEAGKEVVYRIQKFTAGGEFKASVDIPQIVKEGAAEFAHTLHGIAVDPVLHRLYAVEGCRLKVPATTCKTFSTTFGATGILVFSTEPEGSKLVPAGPEVLPLPGAEATIYKPQTLAVDPSTNDLVILGENGEEHLLIQRFSSTGAAGARYVDSGDELTSSGKPANSLAIGPDGTTYTLTGGPAAAGDKNTRAWRLPPSLSQVEPVPGFAEAAEAEGWTTGLTAPKTSDFIGGAQFAISPDGETLYWKETVEQGEEDNDPSNILVRGFSLTKRETTALYGNGLNSGAKRCLIQTPGAGVATVGEELVVFDYGPGEEASAFGSRVMHFGPGGSGCRAPVANFTVNGKAEGEEVTVAKGAEVSFDATPSELLSKQVISELDWDFGDGSEEKVTGSPPVKSIKHTFASAGAYQVTLRMKLEQPETANYGDPLPVTRLVKVTGGSLAKLTVAKAGSGWGNVTSSPGGIACGADCDQEYEIGKEVTLTPQAAAGSKFVEWGGACSGAGECKVTMSAAKAVTATFNPVAKQTLTVVKKGSGTGAVTSVPSGIDCRTDCNQEYETGKEVTLTAKALTGSKFSGWSGACSGTEKTCKVTMNEARTAEATFTSLGGSFALTIEKIGNGTGVVSSIQKSITGDKILCGYTCKIETKEFVADEEIDLLKEANLEDGSAFIKWGGVCSGSGECKVKMDGAKTVTAEFTNPTSTLKVARTGAGAGFGKVVSTPAGISCPSVCEAKFGKAEEVELKAEVSGEAEFVKWTGACTGAGACKVAMAEAREVTAEFKSTKKTQFALKVKKTGTGSGKVTSSPVGVDCGATCESKFDEGVKVTLSQVADPGSEFVKWTGACTGPGACEVTMSAVREVTAEFKAKPTRKLTVKKTGTGSGEVTSSPAGIDCGEACEFEFEEGAEVELSQSADSGSEFIRWLNGCSGSGACTVALGSTNKTVTAEFKAIPSPPPAGGSTPPPATTPPPTSTPPKKKLTPLQRALKKCKKQKGKKRAKCIKKAKKKHRKRKHKRGGKNRRPKDSG